MTVSTKTKKLSKKKQKPSVRTSTTDPAAQEIYRLWGDIPVVDAEEDLRVMILPEDVKKATRKDPTCCVFARACIRSYGATDVLFLRTVAFVDLPDENGVRRAERFLMTKPMRALVEAFDRGETVIPKAGFTLKAPYASHRLDSLQKKSNSRHAHAKARLLDGTSERRGNQGIGAYQSKPITVSAVRNGSGAVHFRRKKVASAL